MPAADPYLNVFHAYRGSALDESERSRPLEDNLTRALTITLARLEAGPARDLLLTTLGAPKGRERGFRGSLLQVAKPDERWPADRSLVVIHAGPALRLVEGGGGERGRADAVLVGDRFLLVIESKVASTVARGQLEAHRSTLGVEQDVLRDVTWDALAEAARAARGQSTTAVGRFLLGEFEEYLRMNGFGGLTHDHFAYFSMRPEERGLIPGVKDALDRLLRGWASTIGEQRYPGWEQRRRGNFRDDDRAAWASLDPPDSTARQPHLTVFIDAGRLGLLANIETAHPHAMFRRAWSTNPETFMEYFRQLGAVDPTASPWRLDVSHRIHVRPRHYRDEVSLHLSARTAQTLPDETLRSLIESATTKPTSKGFASPQISLSREHAAAEVLREPEGVAGRLVEDARTVGPFFGWLGVQVDEPR